MWIVGRGPNRAQAGGQAGGEQAGYVPPSYYYSRQASREEARGVWPSYHYYYTQAGTVQGRAEQKVFAEGGGLPCLKPSFTYPILATRLVTPEVPADYLVNEAGDMMPERHGDMITWSRGDMATRHPCWRTSPVRPPQVGIMLSYPLTQPRTHTRTHACTNEGKHDRNEADFLAGLPATSEIE